MHMKTLINNYRRNLGLRFARKKRIKTLLDWLKSVELQLQINNTSIFVKSIVLNHKFKHCRRTRSFNSVRARSSFYHHNKKYLFHLEISLQEKHISSGNIPTRKSHFIPNKTKMIYYSIGIAAVYLQFKAENSENDSEGSNSGYSSSSESSYTSGNCSSSTLSSSSVILGTRKRRSSKFKKIWQSFTNPVDLSSSRLRRKKLSSACSCSQINDES